MGGFYLSFSDYIVTVLFLSHHETGGRLSGFYLVQLGSQSCERRDSKRENCYKEPSKVFEKRLSESEMGTV